MCGRVIFAMATRRDTLPDDFAPRINSPEDFVENSADKVIQRRADVKVNTTLDMHQVAHQDEAFVNHGDEGV